LVSLSPFCFLLVVFPFFVQARHVQRRVLSYAVADNSSMTKLQQPTMTPRLPPRLKHRRAELQQDRADRTSSVTDPHSRLFLCALCFCEVRLCSRCDRGQIYCGRDCAQDARRQRQREARARHQATDRGKRMHAERNRRYRARLRSVTDQGSGSAVETAQPTAPTVRQTTSRPLPTAAAPGRGSTCRCCGRPISDFVRLSWLRRPRRRRSGSRLARSPSPSGRNSGI
jgi:hypothetical protein